MSRKYFGTDGIRGRVGEFPITPDFVLKLGWAVGMAFRRQGNCRVLIGKDTRSSGYMFESAFEAGLSASGADTLLLGPMPTPGIAYLTRTFHAEAGVVISASHNPHDDNGIKFFSGQGTKLPDDVELMIEELLDAPMTVVESARLGKVSRINDAAGRYIEFCKSSVPTSTDFNGLKVVLDCANGATYKIAPSVFRELGAEVTVLAASPNGLNINDKCGSTHLDGLQAAVVEHHADLGIAFDGDGDRVMMVDHTGAVVDGDGGENSGHIVCCQNTTTGDAIIAALQVLMALKHRGQTLAEARQGIRKCPQVLINVRFKGENDPLEHPSVKEASVRVTEQMGGRGRVLLRKSGTEPLVRVMVEGDEEASVRAHAEQLAKIVSEVCA